MIFDLLTSPQSHQFDPRVAILFAFCFTHYPRQFDMPHDHVQKKINPRDLGIPGALNAHPWRQKKSHLICFISSI